MATVAMNPINQPQVDIPQLQTPIPPGNECHRSINAGTGELRPLSSRAMAPPAPASAFQACGPRLAPEQLPRPADVAAWTAPDLATQLGKPPSPGISAAECAHRLGARTAGVLRGAMIAQQEMFTDQLWELHRLTRVQGQKALLLNAHASGNGVADAWVGVGSSLFSRQLQGDLHTETMESIASLPTVPATLRRRPTRKRGRPLSTNPSDTNAVPPALDGSGDTEGKLSVRVHAAPPATAPISFADCATQQSAKPVRQGTLDSLCKQHNVAAPAVPSTNTVEAATGAPPHTLDPTAAATPDVSSLLNLMLPSAGVNSHLQWYQKNAAPALAGLPDCAAAAGPVNAFHRTMDVPLPDTADPKAQTAPTISSSLWSNSSFAFLPGAMPPPFPANPLADPAGAGLLPYPTMPKFGPDAFRLPSQYPPMPLPQNFLGPHIPVPGEGRAADMPPPARKDSLPAPTRARSKRGPKPANSTGSGNSQRFSGAHSQLDAVPMYGTQQGESLGAAGAPESAPGDTDKSAADILLSLRGH